MNNYFQAVSALNEIKEDIGASRLTPLLQSYMIGLVLCLEQYLEHLYIMLPAVIEEAPTHEK